MVTDQPIAIEAPERITATVALPASKSISNRALIVNALAANPCSLQNLSTSDDTATLKNALSHPEATSVNIGAAGTAMRFLTAFFATIQGHTVTLDGSERMRQRPIAPWQMHSAFLEQTSAIATKRAFRRYAFLAGGSSHDICASTAVLVPNSLRQYS